MPVRDNFFRVEMYKLQKFEEKLQIMQSFKNPDAQDCHKMWMSYTKLFQFSGDLVGRFYRKLYKKYGNANENFYKERLRMYRDYHQELPWIFRHDGLTLTNYNILLDKFQSLQTKMKITLIDFFGEEGYKVFATKYEQFLKNI